MFRITASLICCLLLFGFLQLSFVPPAIAGEKEERVELLQEKLKKLKQLLGQMQEQKLKEAPPTEKPWEPVLGFGQERPAYDQYAYLLAPQMRKETLDSVLQQMHFFSNQDELKERGSLFVVPTLSLAPGETMSVAKYNRALASDFLRKIGVPAALEGSIVVSPDPLHEEGVADGPMLLIDLTGCDQILRSRIFDLLLSSRLFTADGSIQDYLWKLLQSASPQAFSVTVEGQRMWLAVDND